MIVQATGDLLHIPRAEHLLVSTAVDDAVAAFAALAACTDEQITDVLRATSPRFIDDDSHLRRGARRQPRRRRGRPGEGQVDDTAGAHAGACVPTWLPGCVAGRHRRSGVSQQVIASIDHQQWSVSSWRAPLGVVGFVFEGRPNVFADATGVLRTGNTAVFRIGSDALGTARAIMRRCVSPGSRRCRAFPSGAVQLVDSAAHAAGWALFADARLSLAVARGSGRAVAQLGAVARQHGVPASLHGTGGAWIVALRAGRRRRARRRRSSTRSTARCATP